MAFVILSSQTRTKCFDWYNTNRDRNADETDGALDVYVLYLKPRAGTCNQIIRIDSFTHSSLLISSDYNYLWGTIPCELESLSNLSELNLSKFRCAAHIRLQRINHSRIYWLNAIFFLSAFVLFCTSSSIQVSTTFRVWFHEE